VAVLVTFDWLTAASTLAVCLRIISFAGCGGNKEPEPVEYDLDNEDEDWLTTYNLGRTRIGDVLFERMLWKLELECAAATEHALTAAGAPGGFAACAAGLAMR
jgi:hypothetical protein